MNKKAERIMVGVLYLGIGVVVVLIVWGLGALTIWSLNTVFHLGLAYGWRQILAVIVLAEMVSGTARQYRSKK